MAASTYVYFKAEFDPLITIDPDDLKEAGPGGPLKVIFGPLITISSDDLNAIGLHDLEEESLTLALALT